VTRSEQLGARTAQLCLPRKIAFTAAACGRARSVFALCHGVTPMATYDDALAGLWDALRRNDQPGIAGIFKPLTEAVEASCNDTLSPLWVAWLALATFEFPSRLVSTRLPDVVMAQCSGLMLTLAADLDDRLGWPGAPHEGQLARAEWAAQEECLSILEAAPDDPTIPVDELLAAGTEVGSLILDLADPLAEATGWKLHLPLN
jgi:hypothetical protein